MVVQPVLRRPDRLVSIPCCAWADSSYRRHRGGPSHERGRSALTLPELTDGRPPGLVPQKTLRVLHGLFVDGQMLPSELDRMALRSVVADSWRRSLAKGVDPDRQGPTSVPNNVVEPLRLAHPLSHAMPVIRRLLVDDAAGHGIVVAVADATGTLLWVEGDRRACRKAEAMNFVPGADWSERSAGTNAPGTALAVNGEVQIRRSEHFSRVAQPWSCTAAPVHDPGTGAPLGAIDLTGNAEVVTPQTLALVRATAVAVEKFLAMRRLTLGCHEIAAEPGARLAVLGSDRPMWRVTDTTGGVHTHGLSPRHADILVLLTQHPEGLSADHLAVLLDEHDLDVVTARAEMSRLRRAILPRYVGSRPYRLLEPVASDLGDVRAALNTGDVRRALDNYHGALLPHSTAPGIVRLRIELSAALRTAVLASGDRDLLRRWLRLPEARDDHAAARLLTDG